MGSLLHLPTIMVFHACSTLISALLIGNLWRQRRKSALLGFLTLAAAIGFVGTILHAMRPIVPFWVSAGLGLGAAPLALGLFWQAIVAFEGRRPRYLPAVAGSALWLVLFPMPFFQESLLVRTGVISVILGTYSLLGGRELWRGRLKEPLPSRRLAAGVHCARGLVWYSVMAGSLLIEPAYTGDGVYAPWFVLASLFQTLLVILSIITLLILALERDERASRLVAERDPLTNLRNRRSFVAEAETLLKQEKRHAALLLFDIDHFKHINDTHGHAAGDKVLKAFAATLEARMQSNWRLARIGGEEFACLIPDMVSSEAADIAESMRRAVEGLHTTIDGRFVPITVSIGVSATDQVAAALDPLLGSADVALYRSKAEGRNTVRIYQPGQSLHDRLEDFHQHPVAANEMPIRLRRSGAARG